ncbi:MAG: hypothetical protein KBS97_04215, partial [Firmicutes bacterium]|nr:hypothetical protein [Candidatus Fiminaster equi]
MFKNHKCKNCKIDYDETFTECPRCHHRNESLNRDFKHIQMLSWPKQIGLFAMGLGGFELIAFILSVILVKAGFAKGNEVLANMLLNAIVYLILFVSLLFICNKDIKKLLSSFKSWEPYIAGVVC